MVGGELDLKVAWREDVASRWGLILDDQSSFVGLGKDSGESIEVFKDCLIWSSQRDFHSELFGDSGEAICVAVPQAGSDGLSEGVRNHLNKSE